jgi:hypothetical protein
VERVICSASLENVICLSGELDAMALNTEEAHMSLSVWWRIAAWFSVCLSCCASKDQSSTLSFFNFQFGYNCITAKKSAQRYETRSSTVHEACNTFVPGG